MKAQLIYNGKAIEVDVSEDQIEKLFDEKKKTGYEPPQYKETYFYIDCEGDVCSDYNTMLHGDYKAYQFGNCYRDKALAENMARAQKLWNTIHRRAVELCEPIKISDKKKICQIVFFTSGTIYPLDRSDTRTFGTVWFDTEKHCQQVIDEFKDELMWYFTEFKDRADI